MSELEGLPLAVELVRITAQEARQAGADVEAEELDRIGARLRAHRDGLAHVDYRAGRAEVWRPAIAKQS